MTVLSLLFACSDYGLERELGEPPMADPFPVPLTPRPAGTFGFAQGDQPFQFEFNVGNSF